MISWLTSRFGPEADPADLAGRRPLLEPDGFVFEVVPLQSLEGQKRHIPPGSWVSVTCSPTKGIEATMDLVAEFKAAGHRPIPHLAARMVQSREHLHSIADRLAELRVGEVFIVSGDADEPAGPYTNAQTFMRDFVPAATTVRSFGFTGYPDGHVNHDDAYLHHALHEKQRIVLDHGKDGYVATQMCFDAGQIESWITRERAAGLVVPMQLGVAGVVDKKRLITMGARIGVGQSVRYLRKNMGALTKLFVSAGYNPDELLVPLGRTIASNDVRWAHVFTFNQIEATNGWRVDTLDNY